MEQLMRLGGNIVVIGMSIVLVGLAIQIVCELVEAAWSYLNSK